jgi:hypothetical protein
MVMKKFYLVLLGLVLSTYSSINFAGEITDTFTTGDTLTATSLNNIKSAVNDNDVRITANFTTLDTLFSGDGSAGNLTIDGEVNWGSTPPDNPYFGNITLNPGSTLIVPAGTTIYSSGTFLNAGGTLIVQPGPAIGSIGISNNPINTGDSATNAFPAYAHAGDTTRPASMGETNDETIQVAGLNLLGGRGGSNIPKFVATSAFGNFKFGGGSGGGHIGDQGGKGGGLVKIYARINILNQGAIEALGEDGAGDSGIGGGGGGIVILAARSGVQNLGTIDVRGGNGSGNANYVGNGGGGGGGIIIMASTSAPVLGTEIVDGGQGATGVITLSTNTHIAGGGGGGSGGLGGTGGVIQSNSTPLSAGNGTPGYLISLTLDPLAIAR